MIVHISLALRFIAWHPRPLISIYARGSEPNYDNTADPRHSPQKLVAHVFPRSGVTLCIPRLDHDRRGSREIISSADVETPVWLLLATTAKVLGGSAKGIDSSVGTMDLNPSLEPRF